MNNSEKLMGAEIFMTRYTGISAKEAFHNCVESAFYDYVHAGHTGTFFSYTGTIAEKHSYVIIELPEGKEPENYADELIDNCDPRIDDKWGPAGCIDCGSGEYLFFGWAPS